MLPKKQHVSDLNAQDIPRPETVDLGRYWRNYCLSLVFQSWFHTNNKDRTNGQHLCCWHISTQTKETKGPLIIAWLDLVYSLQI